jgi:hypothetical protein
MNNCRPLQQCQIFAAQANPACQVFNADEFQGESVIFNSAFDELINNFGSNVNYYVNTYNVSAIDNLYGEDPTKAYLDPQRIRMYITVSDNAITLKKFGFASDEEFTGYISIDTFTNQFSSLNYTSFGQRVEPKSGDVVELVDYACRPGNRGPRFYEITERVDEDIPNLNPMYGSYVYRLKGKRLEYSFEPGLSGGEQGNKQVMDNSDASKSYPGDIDTLSITKVFDQTVNNTDIYGTYG